ncbi:O-antigen ligase [Streptomyces umbrinus]|uniref:O-antigen ligase n=1 Tax=Streptomyces umbrinus TaxID=67370 RepID=A0ABU0T053_9ACTN|nr:O-antigen ligase family protein [Streptomyces umbrinus]MDQ1029176.1 O-antigen ligase [Streptomyces umbrinus]
MTVRTAPVDTEEASASAAHIPPASQPFSSVSRRTCQAIAGTVAVILLLAGGRWVSHIMIGPVYITDVLLAAAVLHMVCSRLLAKHHLGINHGPGVLVGLVVFATLVRVIPSEGEALLIARDAAPFLYVAVAYLSARGYLLASEPDRRRTARLVHGALGIHLCWVACVVLVPGLSSALSEFWSGPSPEVRSDLDTALLGILAGVSILRFRRKEATWMSALLAGASVALALTMHSRAGLLACCICVVAALAGGVDRNARASVRTVALGMSAVVLLIVLLPSSPAAQRLIATVDQGAASQALAVSAGGTSNARKVAWERVIRFTLDDPARVMIGVGFGPDFLKDADADVALGSKTYQGVRSPHNYLVTVFARLGLLGLIMIAALLAAVLAAAIRELRARHQPDELTFMCVFMVMSLLVIAMLGVVLESPFGAVPFFWAGGVLLARRHRRRRSPAGTAHVVPSVRYRRPRLIEAPPESAGSLALVAESAPVLSMEPTARAVHQR